MACRSVSADFSDGLDASPPLSIDTRPPRPSRPSSVHEQDGGKAAVELASIMTSASNPVSPGPSGPPLDQMRSQDFVPPARPSSTPFPKPDLRADTPRCSSCPVDAMDIDEDGDGDGKDDVVFLGGGDDDLAMDTDSAPHPAPPPPSPELNLNHLPPEIQECILDHLFGYRVSAASKSSVGLPSVAKSWGTALRHSRRKELSELALVSKVWRALIQERLYRHIKLKATSQSLNDAIVYFANQPHLRAYVKHIEIWFPVFQPKYGPPAASSASTLPTVTLDGLTNASYTLPADNCTLEETFYFVSSTFPEVCVLTLEGGERKKAPQVRHFICKGQAPKAMPKISSVRTLVVKGQWNLIRSLDDFEAITWALPNLQEWHSSYSKPKSKSYLNMASILPSLPRSLTTLNICLEGDYRRELSFPPYFLKVSSSVHFCCKLAEAAPHLEHLSYTGRICRSFFDLASRLADPRATKLRSVDITVKNCCRHVVHLNESGSGITDMNFINAFEALVLAGIRSLGRLRNLEYLRIRYVDLDSPVPPLNPYFMLRDGWCSGVWSDDIVSELSRVRPDARFEELSESFGEVGYNKDGRMVISPEYPRSRVLSLKLSNYAYLSGGIAIT